MWISLSRFIANFPYPGHRDRFHSHMYLGGQKPAQPIEKNGTHHHLKSYISQYCRLSACGTNYLQQSGGTA